MPPPNSSADTPIQTHSLPPLIYFYPTVEVRTPGGSNELPENPTSHPQPPTGTELFPRATLNQTLLPQPSSHSTPVYGHLPLYGQLPPLPPPGADHDSRHRRTGYVPRRIMLRDPDPLLNDRDRDQAYGPRIPSLLPGQRQSLYDWAPVATGLGSMYFAGALEIPNPSPTRRDNEDVTGHTLGRMRYTSPPLAPPAARLRPMNMERERRAQQDNSANRPLSTSQGLRRYIRGQPQRTRIWAGYMADAERERERARQRDRDRELRELDDVIDAAIDVTWVPLRGNMATGHRHSITARPDSFRRESTVFTPCKELEETLKYLEKLRGCDTVGESLRLALSSGFTRETAWLPYDGCDCSLDDFLLDTRILKAPETSWLAIGGTFWGSQTTLTASSISSEYSPNRWTVKVNISGIDYENLRLNGTMEAYADWAQHAEQHNRNHSSSSSSSNSNSTLASYDNKSTPDPDSSTPTTNSPSSSSTKDATTTMTPIVTYLEGEIIDFRTHTLQTTSYSSTITDDCLYWQKLEPFSQLNQEELVSSLTSKKYLDKLMKEYVLMRWKEKCFLKQGGKVSTLAYNEDHSNSGGVEGEEEEEGVGMGGGLLTIGGFYFISLRRSDGFIRGYYYDPKSTPYQELVLKPRKRMFPTYKFR